MHRSSIDQYRYRALYETMTHKSTSSAPLDFNSARDKVYCVSDLHVDCKSNLAWLEALAPQLNDTLIVAGDVCTCVKQLKHSLCILTSKFKLVSLSRSNTIIQLNNYYQKTGMYFIFRETMSFGPIVVALTVWKSSFRLSRNLVVRYVCIT